MSGQLPRILMVEDEQPMLVTLLSLQPRARGLRESWLHGDGDEALLVAEEETPDLILLDWMLPHRSGLEVCRQLRRRPHEPQRARSSC